ncbi:hypothetical protein BST63_07720 [Bradyrhizobium canariense]|uniref:Acyltransferase 3 domain-containing protein n=1 Tax=Bradyrhizobium canariense TaxID=255045 RepID=A0ABX3X7T5_9BRAD|nr:acyltransferase family protein [Bradyrhizobium canariense]OSJ09955.1 hypothetical protein BSR47_29585 [Bradyrhizobium canariense]OSJ32474.1 hypothetical protein BST63_07720 [Bradyrhizobium canariense]
MLTLRQDTRIAPRLSMWLNLLRGLAALAVLMFHASALVITPSAVEHTGVLFGVIWSVLRFVAKWGHEAVIIFFVLSGYLVGGPFLIRVLQDKIVSADYLVARLSRMFVVLIPALLLTAILDGSSLAWLNGQSVIDARASFFPDRENLWSFLRLREAVCNAAFLQMLWCKQYGSNLSLWSISNEGLYYLAWFGLVLGVRQRIFLTIPTVVALIVVCSLARTQVSEYTAVSYLVYFLVWMSGALLFCLDKPSLRLLALASALSACLWLYLRRQGLWLASDLMLGCAFVCVLKVLEVRDVAYFADFGFARATSEISFSLYATHVPVAVFVLSLLGQIHPVSASWRSLASFLLITTSCLAVSTAFWWAFESRTHSVRTIIRNTISGLYVKPASKNR